ncbi:hypothetical protein KAT80_02830 [Candidatus Pacearchaeota archaeon]|nr:hypothetical protein [Candidatus Pacearchaeota archaeon]
MVKFLRRTGSRFSKLGKGRKKKQKWRKPTGRDNKMREKRRGYPAVVKIGYKQDVKIRGAVNEKNPVMIMNVKDLAKIKKNEIGIIGSVGKKKKIEIARRLAYPSVQRTGAKIAKEKKIEIYNLNTGKFLKNVEKKLRKNIKEEKVEKKTEKKIKEEDISKTKKVDKEKIKVKEENKIKENKK